MVREYVGARYVPKFMGTYDATQIYEALCVVDNGLGTSYITKIPTPAGTPLTDTTYWAVYGASSGAIINLQNQIDNIENVEMPGIRSSISGLTNDLNSVKDKIKSGVIVIGNSYVGNPGRECTEKFEQLFDVAYRTYAGGIGFATYTDHSTNFETQLDVAIADSSFDNDDITDILFVSAIGDTNALEDLGGSYGTALFTTLQSMKTKIENNFPNIKRIMVTLAESRNDAIVSSSSVGTNRYVNMFTLHRLFKQNLASYGFEYLGWCGFNNLFVTTLFESDNYHPSALGAEVLDQNIIRQYYGGFEYATKNSGASIDCKYTADSKIYIQTMLTPDIASFNTRVLNIGSGGSITLSANQIIADFEDISIPLPPPIGTAPIMPIRLVDSSNPTIVNDQLLIGLETSPNGVLVFYSYSNPTISTAVGNCYLDNLCEVSYPI